MIKLLSISEEKLISKSLQGDTRAFKHLYDQNKRYWYTICLRYMKNEFDSKDMLQNALVKIFTKLGSFNKDKGSFKSWSGRIVVNECLMHFRKNSVHMESLDLVNQFKTDDSHFIDPVSNLSTQEMMNLIQELPEGYRLVFNLIAIDGYTHKEASKKLKISIGTSKSQYFFAKKKLKTIISDRFGYNINSIVG